MVKKKTVKKTKKKAVKKAAKKSKEEDDSDDSSDGGMDLDDAFGDDDDVEYAESKPRVVKKSKKREDEIDDGSEEEEDSKTSVGEFGASQDLDMDRGESVQVKGKGIENLKKGDKIKIDGVEMEIDAHYVMIDHGSTKEMAIECFNPKTDEDFQLRYFSDNVENSMEAYKLDEIIYNRFDVKKIEF